VDAGKINNPISLLKIVAGKGQKASLVTLFCLSDKKNPQPGTCLLLAGDGSITGDSIYLKEVLLAGAEDVMQRRQSSFHNYITENFQFTAFTEFIPPAVSLVIIGAGNDIMPLVAMSAILGWKTTVIDGRPAYAKKERFPASCNVLLAKPEQVIDQVPINDRTAIVLMTHNYNYDLAMLELLSKKEIMYTGMLGPKKKLDRMRAELSEKGIDLTPVQLSRIHSPVGLDIGAETPEEIALSILAEIKTVFAAAKAISLKEYAEPIHNRSALAIGQMHLFNK
jgi:xanthine/CO dehydrogenase XdhC/CoxF family maturation factor